MQSFGVLGFEVNNINKHFIEVLHHFFNLRTCKLFTECLKFLFYGNMFVLVITDYKFYLGNFMCSFDFENKKKCER